MEKNFFVYILASKLGGTLYIGVTSDLPGRAHTHREDLKAGFTRRYGVHTLVYFEPHGSAEGAIVREKQLKKWNRAWKMRSSKSEIPIGTISIRRCLMASMTAETGFPPARE